MSDNAAHLAQTIKAMQPMVPARNFQVSQRFYCDIGFTPRPLTEDLIEMSLGTCSFLLQNYYVQDWANNFVLHLYVSQLQPWWDRIVATDLAARYGVTVREPHRAEWGATVAQMIDPAGVLWWFHETALSNENA